MNSLLVGGGISDRATPGDDPVADAVTAEALGHDFVSAFDHPVAEAGMAEAIGYDAVPAAGHPVRTYPTYETQTLLTWIAARTTRIGLVPRVLGVPFRRPSRWHWGRVPMPGVRFGTPHAVRGSVPPGHRCRSSPGCLRRLRFLARDWKVRRHRAWGRQRMRRDRRLWFAGPGTAPGRKDPRGGSGEPGDRPRVDQRGTVQAVPCGGDACDQAGRSVAR